ncbi:MAG: exosome complex RNA-binding protein Csl4 [Desulfurococcales archaeon]|nr:exosome complex RNA-binding protein Csl4 [Desulfurococcales archaeon]
MSYSSSGRVVAPGEPLGIVEEYVAESGTYVGEDGVIRAAIPGVLHLDPRGKVVRVRPFKRPRLPRAGSNSFGLVTQVKHDLVVLELYGEVSTEPSARWMYEYDSPLTGGVPIHLVTKEYVKDLYSYFRPGDLVLARVLSPSPPYTLTTKPPQHGVVYAQCSRCGYIMQPLNPRSMKCPRCGQVEERKVSVLASSKLLRINLRRYLVFKR